jgi:hypothetical protein
MACVTIPNIQQSAQADNDRRQKPIEFQCCLKTPFCLWSDLPLGVSKTGFYRLTKL